MSELSIAQNTIYLRGEVSFKTVADLNQQLHQLMQQLPPEINTLDCSGITKVDSAIAALLVVALKLSKKTGTTITVTHLPESVSKLIKLYDLQELFEFDKTPQLASSPVERITTERIDKQLPLDTPVIKPGFVRIKIVLMLIALVAIAIFFARNLILGTPVEAEHAVIGDLRQTVVASGRVIWPQRVDVAAEIIGRVARIPVEQGQQVIKGQLLIQLDDKEEQANLLLAIASVAQAEARVTQQQAVDLPIAQENFIQAQADAKQIQKQLTRMSELNAQHFVSQAELETTTRNLRVADSKLDSARIQVANNQAMGNQETFAKATLAQARANLQLAQLKLEQDAIRSPAAGTLISRSVEEGDIVQPGKLLMVLAAQGETQLEVQIDEKNLAKLAIGQVALGSADAFSDQLFTAEIIYINPGIDSSRGSVEIKLGVKDPPAYLRQDMTVSVDIETAKRNKALIIPAAALRDPTGDNPWVLVVRDNHTYHQIVTIGLRGDNNIEILSGISVGEAIILPSLGLIKTGQHVRVISDKTI